MLAHCDMNGVSVCECHAWFVGTQIMSGLIEAIPWLLSVSKPSHCHHWLWSSPHCCVALHLSHVTWAREPWAAIQALCFSLLSLLCCSQQFIHSCWRADQSQSLKPWCIHLIIRFSPAYTCVRVTVCVLMHSDMEHTHETGDWIVLCLSRH